MHDRSSRKIECGNLSAKNRVQESAFSPHHMSERQVNDHCPKRSKGDLGRKSNTFGECSRDQCGSDYREHQLEDHERLLWDRGGVIRIWVRSNSAEKREIKAANEPVSFGKNEAVAEERPDEGNYTNGDQAFQHRREDVLLTNEPAIKEGKTGNGHQQNERAAGKHPGVVSSALGSGRC